MGECDEGTRSGTVGRQSGGEWMAPLVLKYCKWMMKMRNRRVQLRLGRLHPSERSLPTGITQ